MAQKYCSIFLGAFCKNPGGPYFCCSGCWGKIADKPNGQAGYNIFLARNKKEFERCLLETPEERPDVFWNGDRGVGQRIFHVEDLYLAGYNQALQDFGIKGKGKGFEGKGSEKKGPVIVLKGFYGPANQASKGEDSGK